MILDISDADFKRIMNDEQLFLPIQWDGNDFYSTLKSLFDHYVKRLEDLSSKYTTSKTATNNILNNIKTICNHLKKSIKYYLNGFPAKAYTEFENVMNILTKPSSIFYQENASKQFEDFNRNPLKLFRVVGVDDIKNYPRSRVFHTPYNLRSKVSTSRYSIAGYPSLYLGTSLELCCEEIKYNPYQGYGLAAMFQIARPIVHINVRVVELGIKPQDFINLEYYQSYDRYISNDTLKSNNTQQDYLLWYPLIAACSFIRTNKKDAFAPEYIIPQLLMQWVRDEMHRKDVQYSKDNPIYQHELIGIRYFSCASKRMSNMGFNYVFPTSGTLISPTLQYCSVLTNSFLLTKPVYIHEYDSIHTCEQELIAMNNLDFIYS